MNQIRKKIFLFSLLCMLAFTGLTACGETEVVEENVEVSTAEELVKRLTDDSTEPIIVSGKIFLREPVVVTGEKEIIGEATIKAYMQDSKELYMITVADGSKLTVGGSVTINAADRMGAIHVQKGGSALIQEKAIVKNATEETANVLVEGSLEVAGGTLKGANGHNIYNKKETVISGGEIIGSGSKYAGIYNEGTLSQTRGIISKAYNNISNASGSTFTFEGGTNTKSTRDGVVVAEGAKMIATKKAATIVEARGRGILLYGTADIEAISITDCDDTLIKVGKSGVLNLSGGVLYEGNYHGVDNAGTMTMSGGNIQSNRNCGIVNTGTLQVTGGTIASNENKGILNKHAGTADVTSESVSLTSNKIAIANEDKAVFELANAKILMSTMTNVYCYDGTINVHDIALNASTSNNIRVVDGVVNLNNVEVKGNSQTSNTSQHGMLIEGGVVNAKKVTVSMTTGHGIRVKGGQFIGKRIVMHDINKSGLSMGKHDYLEVEGLIDITDLEIQSTNHANIMNEGGGTIKVTNGKLAVATSNSVRSNAGRMELTNVTIPGHKEGTADNVHGVFLEGGEIIATNVSISDTAGHALRNKNGTFIGKNVTITNTKGDTAISNSALDSDHKDGVIEIDGLTITDSSTRNVTLGCGVTTLKNANLGVISSNNHNIKIEGSSLLIMENSKVYGTTNDSKYSIIAEGGDAELTNVEIYDSAKSAIHANKAASSIKGTNVFVSGAVYALSGSNGKITIDGLTTEKISSINILAEKKIKITVKNSTGEKGLCQTPGHNVKATDDALITLKNVEIRGVTASNKHAVMAEGGDFVLENVVIENAANNGIRINTASSSVKGKNVTIRNAKNAITGSKGKVTIDGLTTENIKNNTILAGDDDAKASKDKCTITIKNGNLGQTTSGHNVKSTQNGIAVLEDTIVYGTAHKDKCGVIAEKGSKMTLTDVTIQDVLGSNSSALCSNQKDIIMTGTNVTIKNSLIAVRVKAGTVTFDGLTTENITNKNLFIDENTASTAQVTLSVTNGTLCKTSTHNVHVKDSDGLVQLENVDILGNTSGYTVITEKGGDAELTNVSIRDAATNAIHVNNAGSQVTGTDVSITNANNALHASKGVIEIDNLTVSGVKNHNVYATGGAITVKNSTLDSAASHSMNATGGSIHLENVKLSAGTGSGVYALRAEGGSVTGEGVTITDGNYGICGITGTIDITNLTSSAVAQNIYNEGAAITVTTGTLNATTGNSVDNKGGSLTLTDVDAGTIYNTATLNIGGKMKATINNDAAVTVNATSSLKNSQIVIDWPTDKLPTGLVGIQFANATDTQQSVGFVTLGANTANTYIPYHYGTQMLLNDGKNMKYTVTNFAELQDAMAEINTTDEISMATITVAGNITVTEEIVVNAGKIVRIQDNGTARTIKRDANYHSGIFTVKSGAGLTLASSTNDNETVKLTVDGGSEDGIQNTGGCSLVANNGSLTVGSGVKLANNFSSGNNRGLGVYAATGSTTTFSGVLENIVGTGSSETAGTCGSALVVNGSTVSLIDAVIKNNSTNGSGVIQVTEGGSLTATNTVFKGNIAANMGGAIFMQDASILSVDGCEFTANKATGHGGAITLEKKSSVTISNSTFKNNETGGEGSSINVPTGASLTLSGCQFSGGVTSTSTKNSTCGYGDVRVADNTEDKGGSIQISGKMIVDIYLNQEGKVEVTDALTDGSDVVLNWRLEKVTDGFVGISYKDAAVTSASKEYITLSKNYSDTYVIKSTGTTGTLVTPTEVKSESELNAAITAISETSDKTGFIKVTKDFKISEKVTIPEGCDVTIMDNGEARTLTRATENIILFKVESGASFSLASSENDNANPTLNIDGGSSSITNTGGCSLIDNSGVVYVSQGVVLTNNKSTGNNQGFGIYSQTNSTTTFCGVVSNIVGTHSSVKGNVFVIKGEFTLKNAIVKDNVAVAAAPIRLQGGTLTAVNTTFSNNKTDKTGGAIYLDTTAGNVLTLTGCTFTSNVAGTTGGAIYIIEKATDYELSITGCKFTGNVAGTTGGAISIESTIDANTITDSKFTGNEAGTEGGAINMKTGAYLTLHNCEFTDNVTKKTDESCSTCGFGDVRVADNSSAGAIRISGKMIVDIYVNQAGKIDVVGELTEGSKVIANWRLEKITADSWTGINFASAEIMEASKTFIELSDNYSDTYELTFSGLSGSLTKK